MDMDQGPPAKRAMKKDLLQRLSEGVVVGDGGMIWTMEKRGYANCGFTPEAVVEHPDAVLQVHREFVHNGAEVTQTCNFWSPHIEDETVQGVSVNKAACDIALKAASEGEDILVAGSITKTQAYERGDGKEVIQTEFRRQLEFYVENNFDFVVAEYLDTIEETVWGIEVLKTSGKPVMATMCIGPQGDIDGVSPQECAVRMANAGADLVGVNCRFGPAKCLETIAMMKQGLAAANLGHIYLAVQPFGYHTPDASLTGYMAMAEFPFGVDARCLTRIDAQKYAVEAQQLGVKYIGGCCGFEPRHIRAMSEAMEEHRGGRRAPVTKRYGKFLDCFKERPEVAKREEDYWLKMQPATGRPRSSAMSPPVTEDANAYLHRFGRSAA